jgi:uncharacterized membrane protein
MAAVLTDWGMVKSGIFLLFLQLAGINLAGSLVFRLHGLSARGVRFDRGKSWLFPAAVAGSGILLAGLLTWQFSSAPELQRATRSQRAAAEIREVVNSSGLATLVEAEVRFTRANISGQNTLLGVLYVQRSSDASAEEIRARLTRSGSSDCFSPGML